MSRSEVKRLCEQTYTWKRKFLKRDKSITKLSYIKYGRKDFIFYCSHPNINQECTAKGHGSKKRTNFLLLMTGLAKENGCTDTP